MSYNFTPKKNGSMKDVKKAVVDIIDSAIVTFE